jgi:transmembrane 9 superfamily protein 2/4
MAGLTICFGAVGFVSPANRGSLISALLLLFLFMGIGAGYTTARLHKFFGGKAWQRTTLVTALGFPTLMMGTFLFLDIVSWAAGSANAIGIGSLFVVLILWLIVSVPLVFVGAYYGFKAESIEVPVRISDLPTPIPVQPWYLQPLVACALGGVLPFGAVFVELFFILTSIWLDQYYYVFGFLLLVAVILALTCAEISIVLTYFQLCAGDYRWWWRSFAIPAFSGVYMFLYCAYYFLVRLDVDDFVSALLYFGYMGVACIFFAFTTGTLGHLASFWFLRKIYSAVRVD